MGRGVMLFFLDRSFSELGEDDHPALHSVLNVDILVTASV